MKRAIPFSLFILIAGSAFAAEPATTQADEKARLRAMAVEWADKANGFVEVEGPRRNHQLLSMIDIYSKVGKIKLATDLVDQISDELLRPEGLWRIAANRVADDPDGAIKAVAALGEGDYRDTATDRLMQHFIKARDREYAAKLLEMNHSESCMESLYWWYIHFLIEEDHLQEAAELLPKLTNKNSQRSFDCDIKIRWILFQKQGEGRKEFVRAEAQAKEFTDTELEDALKNRCRAVASTGDFKGAKELLTLMDEKSNKAELLIWIARFMTNPKDVKERLSILAEAQKQANKPEVATTSLTENIWKLRVESGDAAAVIQEFGAVPEDAKEHLKGVYALALARSGLLTDAAKTNYATAWIGRYLGESLKLDEAKLFLSEIDKDQTRLLFCSAVANGLLTREATVTKAQKKK